jgi:hypothetical protein
MKIALDYTSEIGIRAGRLLLGEAGLEELGIVRREVKNRDTRLVRVDRVTGFDAVVTDDPESAILAEAVGAGVPCVLWADDAPAVETGTISVLAGANLVTGIGRSLAKREVELAGPSADVLFAWTEPGKPLRTGEPVAFPDPVGARWGTRRRRTNHRTEIAVPVPDEWAGIVVQTANDTEIRALGIADLAVHVEAIALASGAVTAASGPVPPGSYHPEEFADDYLVAALQIGLGIASFTSVP